MEETKLLRKKSKALSDKNNTLLCAVCTDLASLYVTEGRYEDAIEQYKIISKIYKEQDKLLDFARVNRGIGEAYMHLNNYHLALKHQHIYLEISCKEKSKPEEQRALATLGHIYMTRYLANPSITNKEDLNEASKYFMKSLGVSESLTDVTKWEKADMTARLFCNLGVVQECFKNYEKSEELLMKAINICKSNDVFETLHRAYLLLGSLLEKKEDHQAAIQKYNLALEVAKKLPNKASLMCSTLTSKAEILVKLGDFAAAKKTLLKAYKLKSPNEEERKIVEKNLKVAVVLCNTEEKLVVTDSNNYTQLKKLYEKIADSLSSINCFGMAIEYYKKMLTAAEGTGCDLGPCYYSLAETYKDNEQYDLAVEYFEKEYDLCKGNLKNGLNTLCEIIDTLEAADEPNFKILEVYQRGWESCRLENDLREEGRLINRYIDYLKRNGRHSDISKYQKRLDETGFVSSDSESEDSPKENNSEDDICLDALTDYSEESDEETAGRKRRPKTFVVKRNSKGETQLHTACIAGKTNVVSHLLEQGHPVNVRDNGGWLPLHDACISGHYDIVDMLIKKGAAINDRGGTHCEGITPLHDAAVNGHMDIIELLLNHGANPLAKTDQGETPYHLLKKLGSKVILDPEEQKTYNALLTRMGQVLDKAGQNKEVNPEIHHPALVETDAVSKNQKQSHRSKETGQTNHSETSRSDDDCSRNSRSDNRSGTSKSCDGSRTSRPSEHPKTSRSSDRSRKSDEFKRCSEGETRSPVPSKTVGSLRRSIVDDDDDDFASTPRFSPQKKCIQTSATNEYRRVMDQLRHKNISSVSTQKKVSPQQKAPALVAAQDSDDDWLEDDLGLRNKKRKIGSSEDIIQTSYIKSNTTGHRKSSDKNLTRNNSLETVLSKSSKSSNRSSTKSFEKRIHHDSNDVFVEPLPTEIIEIPESFFDTGFESDMSPRALRMEQDVEGFFSEEENQNPNKRRRQTSMDDFIRNGSPTPSVASNFSNSSIKRGKRQTRLNSFGHTMTKVQNSQASTSRGPIQLRGVEQSSFVAADADPTLAIDVNIEGRLFRVTTKRSLKNTLTIKWLAMEASRRYARKEYMEPVLELTTINGAELVDDDTIDSLFITETLQVEVLAKVIKWNKSSICERYKEACSDCGVDSKDDLCQRLEELTVSLDVSNKGYKFTDMGPLCKAVIRETKLIEVNLSNNFLSLDCLKLLCHSLPTLENLTKLNLSCTCLKTEELRCLVNMFETSPVSILPRLSCLDISENFIGDESLQDLAILTRYLSLKELNLSLLDFTENLFVHSYNRSVQLNLDSLEVLIMKGCSLTNSAIEKFVSWLDSRHIRVLDVCRNNTSENLLKTIVDTLGKNDGRLNFENLDLTAAPVTDSEVFGLLRVCNSIEDLNLSYSQITSITLRRLLESPNVKNINVLGCENIEKYLEDNFEANWVLADYKGLPKFLKISLDSQKYFDALISLWKKSHPRVQIEKNKYMLSISL